MMNVKGTITCPCGEVVYSKVRTVEEVIGLRVKYDGFYFLGERLPQKLLCPKCGKPVVDGRLMFGSTSTETKES